MHPLSEPRTNTPRKRFPALLVAASGFGMTVSTWAGLGEKAPQGLILAGSWQINVSQSDDPETQIDKAREALIDQRSDPSGDRGSGRWGAAEAAAPSGGGGGMTRGGIGGAGLGGGGTWGHNAAPASDDPLRSNTSEEGPRHAEGDAARNAVLRDLEKNPTSLAFKPHDRELKILADDEETSCEPGPKVMLQDRLGDGERECGWQGRAWVVATTRSHAGTRTDRYELSRDNRVLTYTTLITGTRMPRIKLVRVYDLAASDPNAAASISSAR